jgi:hypothetical protein
MSGDALQDRGRDRPSATTGLDSAASRIEWLIDAYFDGELEPDERQELRHELLSSPSARQLFWQMARLKVALHYWAGEHWGEEAASREAHGCSIPAAAPRGRQRCEPFGPRRGPFAAMIAACIVCVGAGAGAAWTIAPPAVAPVKRTLPVANAGFEMPLCTRPTVAETASRSRLPGTFGLWAGDSVAAIEERSGVTPPEGRRMIAFEEALNEPLQPETDWARACDYYQLIDLRPYQELAIDGRAVLQLAARFRHAADAGSSADAAPIRFTCRIRLFDDSIEDVVNDWPHASSRELAMGGEVVTIPPTGRSGEWHNVVARTLVPASATFAIIHIAASPDNEPEAAPPSQSYRYPLAFCDDVRVELLTHYDVPPQLSPRR